MPDARMPDQRMPDQAPPGTLLEALSRAARTARGLRLVDRHEQACWLSYAELEVRAAQLAGGLRQVGVERGDRVALVLPTGAAFFEAFFGALWGGFVPVPLYPPVRLGRLEEYHQRTAAMIGACGAQLVLTDRRAGQLLGQVVHRARPALGCLTVDELPRSHAEPSPCGPDDLAAVQFSSGTTVCPKAVRLTHRNILANVAAIMAPIVRAYPEGPQLTHHGVSWLPLYHDMGLVGCAMAAVAHPGDLTLIPPEAFVTQPAIWLRTISRYRGTISPAPNFAYALCVERIRDEDLRDVDLSCWRVALNGAEPVAPATLRRFSERFAPFGLRPEALTPVYGLAEATLAVTFSELARPFVARRFDREQLTRSGQAVELHEGRAAAQAERPADDGQDEAGSAALALVSVGRPLDGCEVRLVAEGGDAVADGGAVSDGEAVADRTIGRVLVRGPSVMSGYHGAAAETAQVLSPDGWLDSGDLGFWCDGELFLYGRAKDLIVIRGRNHAPQDLEQALDPLEGVRSGCTAALGLLGPEGERLVLLVERDRSWSQDADALQDLRQRVARAVVSCSGLVPDEVVILAPGTLPRTSSGKIRRGEARRQYLLGALAPPRRVTWLRVALEVVRSRLQLLGANGGPA